MFGSVNEYFYKYLAGIRAPTDTGTTEGYKQIHIKPFIPEDLTHAEASLETVRGTASSGWKLNDGEFQLDITIPPNTSGKVHIPDLGYEDVTVSESGSIIWDSNGGPGGIENITNGTKKDGYVTFDTGAGSYSFTLSPI
jgi:alpha-L-rhamnosidase